ncbi:MAG TPA: DUF3159 domain-containing protein [Marisediminicola sp.]|jgi:hypothetical protein|nr:DUF3159 domain-containing protein [Marisediminicola sp.]
MTDPGDGSGSGDDTVRDPAAQGTFREALGAAVRNAGIGQVAPGEMPTAASLLAAVGGARGLIESILPALSFLVIWTLTRNLALSVLVPVATALVFVIIRLVSRTPPTQAFAGVAGVAISAALALFTGRAEDNFLPGLIINVVSLVVLLASLAVRYPLIGVIVGVLSNEGLEWRKDAAKRRVLNLATVLWAGLFAVRLIAELPLYFAGEVELLAGVKLVLGVPFYALVLWVTWLLVRAVYRRQAPVMPAE